MRLEDGFPCLLAFTHNANIEILVPEEELVLRVNLRAAQHDLTRGHMALELSGKKQASFHIPQITTHRHHVRLGIYQKPENGLIAPVRHQGIWQQLSVDSLGFCNQLEIGSGERNILVAEEEIVPLNGEL
jgi:hypothetical protein